MNAVAKLLAAMRRHPLDWQIGQLQTVARQYGIEWRHDGTSHCVFIRADGRTLPVPAQWSHLASACTMVAPCQCLHIGQ